MRWTLTTELETDKFIANSNYLSWLSQWHQANNAEHSCEIIFVGFEVEWMHEQTRPRKITETEA